MLSHSRLQKIAGEVDDDESTVVTNGFDEIFASAVRVVHGAPSGGGGGGRDVTHEAPSNAITKEQEVEQQCIGGAVKGFFRKVFKG